MKKTLAIITLLIITLVGFSDHERINIKADFIILNGDTIHFNNQVDGMMIYRVGGKWVNVPDTFLRDSIYYNGRWYGQGDTLEFTFPPADSTFIELDDTPDSYPANDYGYGLIAGREEVKFSQMFGSDSTGTWVRTVGDENIVSQRFNSTWGGDALYLANNLNADLVDVEFYEDLSGLGIKFLNENSKITLYINDGLVPNTFAEFVFTTGTSSGNGTDEEWHIVANGVDYGWRAAWAYQAPRLAIGNNTSLEIEITLRSSRIYPRSKGSFMTYTHASVGKPSRSLKIVDDNHNTIYSMPGYIGSPGMPLVADEGTTQLKWANKIWIDTLIANVVLTDFVNNFIGDTIYLPSIRVDTIYMGDTPVNLESDSIFYKDKWLANGDTLTVVETDPVYSASSWKTTTNNSANWNTAYGWGNHAGLYRPIGYVPAWSEITSKPTFATVATSGSYADLSNKPSIPSITNLATKAALTDTAAQLRSEIPDVSNFITGYTETDPLYNASSWKTTTNNSANWNTAYGWGNHAGLYRPIGYVPAWSEITSKPSFATVATSGSYNDLINKPTIPSGNQIIDWKAANQGTIHATNYVDNNTLYPYAVNSVGTSGQVWKSDGSGVGVWGTDNNTTYDISGIATNASAISTIQGEQTTQNSAIALNTAKVGITTTQASAITANTAKVGITTTQASAIVANTAKVGVTDQEKNVNADWNATTGDAQILNKPTIPDVSSFISSETDPIYNASSWKTTTNNSANWNTAYGWGNHAGLYRPIGYVPTWSEITSKPSFATVATSGSYNDLINKPTIPSGNQIIDWKAANQGTIHATNYVDNNTLYPYAVNSVGTSGQVWKSDGSGVGVWGTDNNTTYDISGIATNASAISTIQGEQTTQNSAIALNTAKVGITTTQASAITANTAKVGITTTQASAIVANTAKVGVTDQEKNVNADWNATTGDAQILNKPTIPDVSSFISSETDPIYNASSWKTTTNNSANWNTAYGWGNHAGLYRPIGYVPTWSEITSKPSFATVATSGSYNDLINKPTIPSGNQIIDWKAANQGTIHATNYVDNNTLYPYAVNSVGTSGQVWKSDGSGVGVWGTDNNTTYDISGIATNASAISTIQGEQTTQNSAIALNTAKVGITTTQASAITANTAKVGITTTQASAIVANTAKVGVTDQEKNVNADWNATTGDAQILNKPSIPDVSSFISTETDPKVRAGTILVSAGTSTIYFNSEFVNSWYVVNATGMKNGNEDIHVWVTATNKAYFTIDVVTACTITYSAIKY